MIESSGDGGGALLIAAGHAQFTLSRLSAHNLTASLPDAGIQMRLLGDLTLNDSWIESGAADQGAAGGIAIDAVNLTLTSSDRAVDPFSGLPLLSGLFSEVESTAAGASGAISLDLSGKLTFSGSVGIIASSLGLGGAGEVEIQARELELDGRGLIGVHRGGLATAGIRSESLSGLDLPGGRVGIALTELTSASNRLISIRNGATLSATSAGGRPVRSRSALIHCKLTVTIWRSPPVSS